MSEMTEQKADEVLSPLPPEEKTADTQAVTPTEKPKESKEKRQKKKKRIKRMIIAAVVLALLTAGGIFLYRFLTKKDEVQSTIQTQPAQISSIQSTVQGSGSAKAKESAAITLTAGGTVQEVDVTAGDVVTTGQPLYRIHSQAAEDEVVTAQDKVESLQEDMKDLQKDAGNLTVRAPFAGKLILVGDFQTGSDVSSGAAVATLVNDKKLKLSLYFSYAYEEDISVGQSVSVSIPAVMGSFSGQVEQVNKVSYITPEGAVCFEVVVSFDNPGTLTEAMSATGTLTAPDGTAIYPYQAGKTEYYEVRKIVTEASGPLVSENLLRYANVNAGDVLLVMGSDTIDSDMRAKQKEIDDAMETLTEAQKNLENFHAVAPIDGTVTSCTLTEGAEVKSGDTVLIISNTTTMLVTITVDDRNISFVKPGMMVDLTDYNGNVFTGTVTSINTGGSTSENGMTSYPVVLTVDNYDGALMEGVWLDYSFVASQSDDCVVVPMQSVKYVSDDEGNTSSVVFIRADSRPDNAVDIEIPETEPGQTPTYPSENEGFYPVPVTTGLSDNYNVEIKDGLQGGEEVFVNYYVDQGSSWG